MANPAGERVATLSLDRPLATNLAALETALRASRHLTQAVIDSLAAHRAQTHRRPAARTVDLSEQVRRISHQLHPAALEHVGRAGALRSPCQEFEQAHPTSPHAGAFEILVLHGRQVTSRPSHSWRSRVGRAACRVPLLAVARFVLAFVPLLRENTCVFVWRPMC